LIRGASEELPPASGARREPVASDLTRRGAAELASLIARGELSAREVVEAHVRRIEQVEPHIHALAVPRFEQALAEAQAADDARARGQSGGPLDGVPITIKECFHLAGAPSCMGLTHRRDQLAGTTAPLVQRLQQAGAIVLGKTNVPQLMFYFESDNPVYGRTDNPWNTARTPGGSTGGEAALIAAGGVPLGLGSDLGGSIRVPGHFCGVHGLKPTSGRLTRAGTVACLRGMEAIVFQAGPLARRVEDLELAFRVLCARPPDADRDAAPSLCGDAALVRLEGMRIASWDDDGYFPASPAIRRAVQEAAGALRDQGAVVEKFSPPRVPDAIRIYLGLVTADGMADLRRLSAGSQLDRRLRFMFRLARIPRWSRPLLAALLRTSGQHRSAELLRATSWKSADQYWQLVRQRSQWEREFFAAFRARGFEALICPPFALPALRHGDAVYLLQAGSYAFLANLLGIPCGVVAATRVREDEQSDRPHSRDLVDRRARRTEQNSTGLPVGVQVAAPHWREDVVLAVMSALESHFRAAADYPQLPPL